MDKVVPQNENEAKSRQAHKTAGLGISDRELAKKDVVQKDLTLALDWMVANKVLIILLLGVMGLSGIGYVIYNQVRLDTNIRIQDQYFAIEKDYLKIKSDFEEADKQATEAAAKALAKKDPKAPAELDEKKPAPKARATGELEKDYGTVLPRFLDLINANPKVTSSKVAAMVVADLYWDYKKLDLAAQVLEKTLEPSPKELVDYMVLKKLSSTNLSLGQFDAVLKKNQAAISNSKYPFMSSQFKLQMGLAYEGLKQWEMAEAQFKDVINKAEQSEALLDAEAKLKNRFESDVSAAELAQKYLLLLRLKKSDAQAGV